MKKLSKKTKIKIGIGIAVALLLIAAAVAYVFFTQKDTEEAAVATEVPLSETPNLGACQLTTPEKIKSSERAEGLITSVSEGTRIGIKSPDGSAADACRYTFKTSSSSDNTITVAAYPALVRTDTNPVDTGDYSWSQAANTSPQMYFAEKKTEGDKRVIDIVRQPLGGTVLLLTLEQSVDALTFPKGAAQWFLADVAKNANVSAVETTEVKSVDTKNSDGPGAPPATTKVETLKPNN